MVGYANAVIALVGAYVLTEPFATFLSGKMDGAKRSRAVFWGGFAAVAGFVFLGIPSAWPLAVVTGVIAALSSHIQQRGGSALRMLSSNAVALGLLIPLALYGLPLLERWGSPAGVASSPAAWWPNGVFTILLVVTGGYVTVEWGCALVDRAIRPFAEAMTTDLVSEPGLPSGGRMIGRLERLVIYLFILVGAPTAIGFLVTAKSILRFGEIKDREMQRVAEYIIIGTLLSFAYALVAGYLTRLALTGAGRGWLLEMM